MLLHAAQCNQHPAPIQENTMTTDNWYDYCDVCANEVGEDNLSCNDEGKALCLKCDTIAWREAAYKAEQGKIAPHEGCEIELVQNGTKPLAVIEQRKQPDVYSSARKNGVAGCYVYVNWHDEETGFEAVIVDQRNMGLVLEYLEALEMPESTLKHRTMGRLFGYSQADIDEFIANQPACNCSKCTGGTK
jgi:hypothetical protein